MKSSHLNQSSKTIHYIDRILQTSFEGNLKLITFDVVSIDFPMLNDYFNDQDDVNFMVHLFQQDEILTAYAPFLVGIRHYFKNECRESLSQILTEIGLYTLQIPLFVDFILGTPVNREPEVLREEVYYEKMRLVEGIVALLSYISLKKDLIVFLDHVHFAPEGTLEIIQALINSKCKMNIFLLLVFDSNYFGENEDNSLFSYLLQDFESKDLIIRLESSYYKEDSYVFFKPQDEVSLLQIMGECLDFLAISDCLKIANHLYTSMNSEIRNGHEEQYYTVLKTMAKAYYYQRDKESAMFYDNMALSVAIELNNQKDVCDTKIRLSYDHVIRGDHVTARKYATDAYELATRLGDTYLVYKCHFLNFMIDKDSLHIDRRVSDDNLNILINETQKYGYDNYLSLIYTNPYELHDNYSQEKEERLKMGIAIVEKLNNEHQLGNAYHNWGIAYSANGKMDLAYDLYRKSQVLKEKIQDNRRVSFIYNSLGYYYMEMEQYILGHAEFTKSLRTSLASRDYHEMCMTLYNIMLNAFMFEAYTFVCDIAIKLIKLLSMSKLMTLKYHSKKMIYNLYIIALIKCGMEARAIDTYNKVFLWGLEEIEDKREELFTTCMVEFYLAQNTTLKETLLNKAESYIPFEDKSITHFRNYYFLEKITFYREQHQNYYKKVLKLFVHEISDATAPYTFQRLDDLMHLGIKNKYVVASIENKDKRNSQNLQSVDLDFERIVFTAKMDNSVQKLHHRINQINFLNLVQTMLFNEENSEQLILNLQQLIHGNTKVEKTYCRRILSTSYSHLNMENPVYVINEVYAERIFGYIKDKTQASILHFGNASAIALKKVYGYSSLMYLPIYSDKERVVELLLMTQKKDEKFNQDDLNLYNLISRQAGEALSRINKNEMLEKMNWALEQVYITDVITGLANRNALELRLQKMQIELKSNKSEVSCMFIDLDNFKYYNDTYGHDIGDRILKFFGEILQRQVSKEDFVARFGGDEFVVILIGKSSDALKVKIEGLAQRIYTQFEEHCYFEDFIGKELGQAISIPDINRISCSIGAAGSYDTDDKNVYTILKLSDLALYAAKNQGKKKLVFHGEV
jgi:diguanylate cyclase (GGDEF)-like protein